MARQLNSKWFEQREGHSRAFGAPEPAPSEWAGPCRAGVDPETVKYPGDSIQEGCSLPPQTIYGGRCTPCNLPTEERTMRQTTCRTRLIAFIEALMLFGGALAYAQPQNEVTDCAADASLAPWEQGRVIPALGRGGPGEGYVHEACLFNCLDNCSEVDDPELCQHQCFQLCQSRSTGSVPSPTPDPVNHQICVAGCWAWYYACAADLGVLSLGTFMPFCTYIRDQCLQPCP